MVMATAYLVGGPFDGQTREIPAHGSWFSVDGPMRIPRLRPSNPVERALWAWLPASRVEGVPLSYIGQGDGRYVFHDNGPPAAIPPPAFPRNLHLVPFAVYATVAIVVERALSIVRR